MSYTSSTQSERATTGRAKDEPISGKGVLARATHVRTVNPWREPRGVKTARERLAKHTSRIAARFELRGLSQERVAREKSSAVPATPAEPAVAAAVALWDGSRASEGASLMM